jgi:hypothetical protein
VHGNAAVERLRVGIGGDEIDAIDALADHVIDGVATGTADTDHLDHRISFAACSSFSMISNIVVSSAKIFLLLKNFNRPDTDRIRSSFRTTTSCARKPA